MNIGRIEVDGAQVSGDVRGSVLYAIPGGPFGGALPSDEAYDLDTYPLLSPCDPMNVYAVLSGWMPLDGSPLSPEDIPYVTPKLTGTISGDGGTVICPSFLSKGIWIGPEPAVVVGHELFRATSEEAKAAILGFTIFNDVTAFEYAIGKFTGDDGPGALAGMHFRAKCIETFASLGPWIATHISDDDFMAGLEFRATINGETRVSANTRDLKWPPSEVVSRVSMFRRLHPGDVISLGFPPPHPPPVAWPGDSSDFEIEGIGILRNHYVPE
jgi:2-keto-4-pentenoate hydratase/2-oxohepta-3-ene-1,7-dioic acid hydratase in catechol pathway